MNLIIFLNDYKYNIYKDISIIFKGYKIIIFIKIYFIKRL